MDKIDTITMDVSFLIRILEISRELIKDDNSLHVFAENIIKLSKKNKVLDSSNLDELEITLKKRDETQYEWFFRYLNNINEKAPKGWEETVKAMKKHDEIDNPYALTNYMNNKGYKSHKKKR